MIYGAQSSRAAISHEIARRKHDNPLYSMNSFAKRSGISLAYLSLILSGKRRLPAPIAERMAEAAHLSVIEREYFLLLVKRENAEDEDMRAFLDKKIQDLRKKNGAREKDLFALDVIQDWHYSAILEAINIDGLVHSASAIGKKLNLKATKVKQALNKLMKIGLMRKESDRYERNDGGFLNTKTEVKSLALRNFHKQILRMGIQSLEADAVEERSCTGITMAIDPEKIPEAKRRILAFQKELMQFLEDGPRKEIYQLETIFFRLKDMREQK